MRPLCTILSASMIFVGCASYEPGKLYTTDGDPVSEGELQALRKARLDELGVRSSADLACDATQITCLREDVNGRCMTATVVGCDQSGTYLWLQTGPGEAQWSLDAARRAPTE